MKIHRFFIAEHIVGETLIIKNDDLIHQWRNVFRYNVGSAIVLFDGSGFEYDAVIASLENNKEATVTILHKKKGLVPKKNITLFQSLIKKDNMDWVVQKATELGVSKIVPIVADRSEKKGFNIERAKKIAIEAAEQSGRANVPEIGEVMEFEESMESAKGAKIIFDIAGDSLYDPLESVKEVSVFIGPEGGWTPGAISFAKTKGAVVCNLGELTLRAETATAASLTLLAL